MRSSSQVIVGTPPVAKVVTPEPAPEPKELPTTASPYPGIALTGAGALFAALTMSRLRRRRTLLAF